MERIRTTLDHLDLWRALRLTFAGGAIVSLTAIGATSCGTTGKDTSPTPDGSGEEHASPLPKPDPLSVTPVLDPAHASEQTIPVAGGTVKTTAADGTEFALSIPEGALLEPTTVTLTPVTSIGGLPMSGGLEAAVDISPDGLYLYAVATLTITPAKAMGGAETIGFGYRGSGSDFHLEPLLSGTGLVYGLVHFSGYGAAQGTSSDVAKQLTRVPAIFDDVLAQDIAQVQLDSGQDLRKERRKDDEPIRPQRYITTQQAMEIDATLQSLYTLIISPEASEASTTSDIGYIEAAMNNIEAFALECQLLGDMDLANKVRALLPSVVQNFLKVAIHNVNAHCHESNTNFSSYANLSGELARLDSSATMQIQQLVSAVNGCKPDGGHDAGHDAGHDSGGGSFYCACNTTCYTDETTCVNDCKASLACFSGICGPATSGQCTGSDDD
jgi:hypothetical protein